jgi:hypothetical protein
LQLGRHFSSHAALSSLVDSEQTGSDEFALPGITPSQAPALFASDYLIFGYIDFI